MSYTIIDVERQTGISSRTLRFWAEKNLFPFTQRDKNGVRYFAKSDVDWAVWIDCLRSIDMSLEDIRRYIYLYSLGFESAPKRKDLLVRQKAKLEANLERIKAALKKVETKIYIYDEMERTGKDLLDAKGKYYYKNLPKYKHLVENEENLAH